MERREGRGIDEKAPSISPMKGECSATTWDSWVAFLCGGEKREEGLMRKPLHLPHEGGVIGYYLRFLGIFCVVRVIPTGLTRKEE